MHPSRDLRRAGRMALGLALLVGAVAVRAETPVPDVAPSPRIVVTGSLDRTKSARLLRRVETLVAAGETTILFDLDGASGSPKAVLDLANRIHERTDVRTVACVTGANLGAASVLALACDEIRMTKSGLIGSIDCGKSETDRSIVAAALRTYRSADILPALEGMVLSWLEVYRVEFGDGTVRVVEKTDLAFATRDAEARGGIVGRESLVREDAFLTLDAARAASIGLTGPVARSADAVARELGIPVRAGVEPGDEAAAPTADEWSPPQCTKAAVIFLEDTIEEGLEARIKRRVEQIVEDGSYDLLVIETDSPGGTVHHSMLIGDLVFETGESMHTVAWIPRKAISGACLTSYAAKDIIMGPAGTIGDCQPIVPTSEGYEALGEKIQSPLRAVFRKYAQRNGYAIPIAEAMVSQEIEVLRAVNLDTGETAYFRGRDWRKLDPAEQAIYTEPEVVIEADELPTFTANEAEDYDLARRVVSSRDELLALYGVSPENVTLFEITWSEELSSWLLRYKFILFLVGLIALYLEFKAPGFGAAGIVGIGAFALFFFAGTIGGVADSLEIVLFLIGMLLIFVELFVTPGFGLPGIGGLILIIVSLYLASSPFVVPNTPLAQKYLFAWMLHFGGALIGATLFAVAAARFLPSVPMFRRLMLSPPGDAAALTASGTRIEDATRRLVGAKGVALTDLRPAGRADVEGRRLDVVTQGSFIDAGVRVVVVKVKGNRIVVRPGRDRSGKDDAPKRPRRDFNY